MSYQIKYDPAFKADYKRVMRLHPALRKEFQEAVRVIVETDTVPEQYTPHKLKQVRGNYNGHIDFQLSDGKVDVVVLYLPHKTSPIIRFVRMGSHNLLFKGSLK